MVASRKSWAVCNRFVLRLWALASLVISGASHDAGFYRFNRL